MYARDVIVMLLKKAIKCTGYKLVRSEMGSDLAEVILNRSAKRNPLIYDVGAHEGESITYFKRLFPDSCICSFEPNPQSFELCKKVSRRYDRVSVFCKAVGSSVGSITLHENALSATDSLLPLEIEAGSTWNSDALEERAKIQVSMTTLDQFCSESAVAKIDILKIDVQGYEFSVIDGASELLSRRQVDLLIVEIIMVPIYIGQKSLNDYLSRMEALNYRLITIVDLVWGKEGILQADFVFAPDKHSDV